MSGAVVLEYSRLTRSPWLKWVDRSARSIFNALIILFASAAGAGIGYLAEPTVFEATGYLRFPFFPPNPTGDLNQIKLAESQLQAIEALKGIRSSQIAIFKTEWQNVKSDSVPVARVGGESVSAIIGTTVASVTVDADDAPSAARDVELIGDTTEDQSEITTPHWMWYSKPPIPASPVHNAAYYGIGALSGGGVAVALLLAMGQRKRSVR